MAAKREHSEREPRTRRARDSLSKDVIVAAARRVALREGIDGLTFQALGNELDAHPTSVYRHIRDKDELVLEVVDSLRAQSYGGTLQPTDDWLADLRHLNRMIHEHYMRLPELAMQMAARTTRRPMEFATVEFALDALRRGGFPPAERALYSRAMGNLVRSLSAIESSLQALPEHTRAADEMSWRVDYGMLDAEQFPNIAECSPVLASVGDPRAWETAMEVFLEGLAARSRQHLGEAASTKR